MKLQMFDQSMRYVSVEQKTDEKELAAFFTMLTLLVFMVANMTGAPAGL